MIVIEWIQAHSAFIQAISMVVLVGVTIAYVLRTHAISKATEKQAEATRQQAEASVEMAEEMRKQRLSEAQPHLIMRLGKSGVGICQWEADEKLLHPTIEVIIENMGDRPAINLEAFLWHPTISYFSEKKGDLSAHDKWPLTINKVPAPIKAKPLLELGNVVRGHDPGVVAVKYQDIYGHVWITYLLLERYVNDPTLVTQGEQHTQELQRDD